MTGLSTGVVADIIEGAHPENPILQILSMKRIPTGSQERYRLLVSDGEWSSSFAMLATHLNCKVTEGVITNNCIIQMNRYVCNTVQGNKKVLIILEMKLERTGEEVGLKLGDPVNYDPNKSRPQQQPMQQQRSQPHLPTPSMGAIGGTPQRNPLGEHNPLKQGISPSKTPTGGNVHPICSLTPYQNKVNIHVKKSGIGEGVPPSPPEYNILATAAVQKVKKGLEAAIAWVEYEAPHQPDFLPAEPAPHQPDSLPAEPSPHLPDSLPAEPSPHLPDSLPAEPSPHLPDSLPAEPAPHLPDSLPAEPAAHLPDTLPAEPMPSSSGCSVSATQPRTGQHASSSAPVSSSVTPGTSHGPFSHSPLLVLMSRSEVSDTPHPSPLNTTRRGKKRNTTEREECYAAVDNRRQGELHTAKLKQINGSRKQFKQTCESVRSAAEEAKETFKSMSADFKRISDEIVMFIGEAQQVMVDRFKI